MNSLRLQNDPSLDQEELEGELSEQQSDSEVQVGKGPGRPGRPKGKGRPKRNSRMLSKRRSEEQEEWEERVKVRERATPGKQQSSIEGYIRIIDYLKKIDYDEGSIQNKMNPYNALTATCFWYSIGAEYFSFDFFNRKNSHDIAMEILDKVHKLPLVLPHRVVKIPLAPFLLNFESPELNLLGHQLSDKMGTLIPAPLPSRPQVAERRTALSSVTEDDQFISSTRTLVYNYIAKKIKNSEKWGILLSNYAGQIAQLPPKQFERLQAIQFQKQEQQFAETNLFQLLRQQAKKKIQKREIKKKQKNQNQIYQEEEGNPQEQKKSQNKPNQDQQLIELEEEIKQKIQNQCEQMKDQYEQILSEIHPDQLLQQEIKEQDIIKEQVEHVETQKTYQKHYGNQQLIIDSILQMPIDKIISILQSSLPTVQLPEIKESFMPIPTKDPLEFVYQLHPEEEQYLEYMKAYRKKVYRQKVAKSQVFFEQEERQGQYEDAKCQICTDGDYTDDNLIVFCSMCNISLHQRCVGLAKVPAQSWVCDVCLSFGPAGINLPCPLCNVKGGAMKRTTIHIDVNLFKQTNPGYYEYARKCPYNKQKEEYLHKQKIEGESNEAVRVVREKGQKEEDCYYDYFVKSTYPNDVPACHYVWVHYVCAIWVPECYFQQKNGVISVKGIQNIQKRRFKNDCFVCKKNKCGAAVKCQDGECDKYYHPECARKKKVYMQQLNLQKLKYLIFCQEHEPLKLTRQIQYKKKKSREQIIKFARMIQKYIETYRIAQFPFKLLKSAVPSTFIQTVIRPERDQIKERRQVLCGGSDQQFLKQLIVNLSKAKMMTVHLQKIETGYKITNIQTPSKRQIRKCLNRYDQFWNSIKNGETNEQNFKRYERIMNQNHKLRERLELFLNGSLSIRPKQDEKKQKKVGRKRGKHAVQQVQTLIEQEGGIFCICKKPYQGETDMLECQVCGEWYHFACLGFIGTEEDAQQMEFKCMKCMKFEEEDKKDERLQKYLKFFGLNSILYNYRPPTPELMSQEEVEQKNYNQIIEQAKKSKDYLLCSPQKAVHIQQKKQLYEQQIKQMKQLKQVKQLKQLKQLNEVAKEQKMQQEPQIADQPCE